MGLALSQLCQAKTDLIRSKKHPNRLPIKIHECEECGFRSIETPSYEDQLRAKRYPESGMKNCKDCGEEKPISEFHKHPKTADRLQSKCKLCVKKAYIKNKT